MKHLLCCCLLSCLCISAVAGDCVIKSTRNACPGKEKESFSKCGGQPTCDETVAAESATQCAEKALKACDIARPGVTKSKSVTATFDGKPLDGGKNFCAADRPDFNKCE